MKKPTRAHRRAEDDWRLRKAIQMGWLNPDAGVIHSGLLSDEDVEEWAWQENEAIDLEKQLDTEQRKEWDRQGKPRDVASLRRFASMLVVDQADRRGRSKRPRRP